MTVIDARGHSCPEPVLMLKKAMASKESCYDMLVSSRSALENVTRFANNQHYTVTSTEELGEYKLLVKKN